MVSYYVRNSNINIVSVGAATYDELAGDTRLGLHLVKCNVLEVSSLSLMIICPQIREILPYTNLHRLATWKKPTRFEHCRTRLEICCHRSKPVILAYSFF
jgi:hypothetical protein